jgi:hypothetical protein
VVKTGPVYTEMVQPAGGETVYTEMVQPADGERLRTFCKRTATKTGGNGVEVNGLHTRSAADSTASYSIAVG